MSVSAPLRHVTHNKIVFSLDGHIFAELFRASFSGDRGLYALGIFPKLLDFVDMKRWMPRIKKYIETG